jgi:hypothetical protein
MATNLKKKPIILMPKGKGSVSVAAIRAAVKKVKAERRGAKK